MIAEWRGLNTREARVAFADTWLKTWAYDFEKTWPVIYQIIEWVEAEKLYQDPRATSDEHFDDLKSYFEARLKKPFTLWFELERTHHYVTNFAPELVERTFTEANAARAAEMQARDAQDMANVSRQGQRSDLLDNDNTVIQEVKPAPTGTSVEASLRRLRKDRPDIHARVLAGEITAHAGMIEAGFRKKAPSKKRSRVELVKAQLAKLSSDELVELRDEIDELLRGR
jgi:hypothetical protein